MISSNKVSLMSCSRALFCTHSISNSISIPAIKVKPLQGQVNSFSQDRPSPDPSLPRAPTGFEYDRALKHVLICLRCRVLGQHRSNTCPYRKFCSYCQKENHTDAEHTRVHGFEANSQSENMVASMQQPQQQQ